MILVNAMGDACPIPVVKTLNAIRSIKGGDVVETLVDNDIAVQNLTKMANNNGYAVISEQLGEKQYKVTITVGEGHALPPEDEEPVCTLTPNRRKNVVVAVSSDKMGEGSPELGTSLIKAFLYALGQQETLPETILFYNGGAALTCEGSPALEDLKEMQARGVKIFTCGTCLNFYGLTDQLRVGEVTNMYSIVELLTGADLVVKP